jgi:putative sigma-54 modulation protein
MRVTCNFKNFEPSEHLKKYAATRFEKLAKYLRKEGKAEVQVNLEVEKFRQIVEVVLTADNMNLSAREETEDMYSAIDLALDKMLSQVKKLRDKQTEHRRKGEAVPEPVTFEPEEGPVRTIHLSDYYEPKPMDMEEAALQLDTMDHAEFLVFRNADNDRVNVIFKRRDNDFGLIDPGV